MKLNKLFAALVAPALLLCGCSTDDPGDAAADIRTITVKVSKTEAVITADNLADEVLAFTWSDDSHYAGTASYTLEIALADGSAAPYAAAGIGSKSKAFTGEDMRSLLFGLGVGVGERVELKAAVSAVAGGSTVNRSTAVTFAAIVERSELEPIALVADPLTVVLRDEEGEALGFAWSDPNSYKEGVTYRFELDVTGNGFATADIRETDSTSLSYTNSELNELLLDKWHGEAGIVSTLDARVTAVAGGNVQTLSQTVCIDVTPYGTAVEYSAMALYGTAVNSEERAMTKGEGQKFTFSGYLGAGDVYFRCNPDGTGDTDWFVASVDGKAIVSGATETIVLAPAGSDRKPFGWKIETDGFYSVEVDVESRTALFTLERKIYSAVSMVGPATPEGWEISKATPLSRNGFLFDWEGELTIGTVRFICDPDGTWETDQYIASERDKPVVSGETQRLVLAAVAESGRGDNMWSIETAGKWHITLDLETLTAVFTLLEAKGKYDDLVSIHLVGSATPGGWDAGNMTPMSYENGLWKWSGHLADDEIKFVCNHTGDDWGTYQLQAVTGGDPVSVGNAVKKFNKGGEDNKWVIMIAGDYEIEIDLEKETVTYNLVKSDAEKAGYTALGLIGGAAPQGWSFDFSNSTLTPDADGIFTWTGYLKAETLHMMCNPDPALEWSNPRITALAADTEVVSGEELLMHYRKDDNSWKITDAGMYEVKVDLHRMTVLFTLVNTY